MPIHTKNNGYQKGYFVLAAMLSIAILMIGTGLVEAKFLPKDEIIVSVISVFLLLAVYIYNKNFALIEPKIFFGFLLFNCFFLLRLSFPAIQNVELKTYFIHIMSLGTFLAVYYASKQLLLSPSNSSYPIKTESLLSLLSLIAIVVLFLMQLLQIYNSDQNLYSRPGGYLNPNTTASIALIFMFTAFTLSHLKINQITSASLFLTTCIILLAQSRAAILAFVLFFFYIAFKWRKSKIFIALPLLLLALTLVLFTASTELTKLIHTTLARFEGDLSSTYRLTLLQQGWSAFIDAPIWGNGYRYISSIHAYSTHNEIIETLANFGLVGLLFIGIASYLLYTPFGIPFCVICIFPILMFSHNFFDSYAFQAVLGLALASEKYMLEQKTI